MIVTYNGSYKHSQIPEYHTQTDPRGRIKLVPTKDNN